MRMPLQPSPLGGIAQRVNDTMMKFFLSQPGPLERDYMQAGVDQRRAAIETERAKAAREQQKFAAPGSIASAFQSMLAPPEVARPDPAMVGPMPQMSRDDAVRQYLPGVVEGAAALNLGDLGKTILALTANAGGTSNDMVTRAFAGAGGKLGVNDALLPERQDQLRTENFGQETSLNNADNAAAMARQSSANAAAAARQAMANSAAMARQLTTEQSARGAAFRAMSPEQQALAVGPTAEEAKGGWIADIMTGRRPMNDDAGAVISPSIAVAGIREAGENARFAAAPPETNARGAAFRNLDPAAQAMAVGPTSTEAQGGLISRYFESLGNLDPYQRQVLGANPSSSSTPRNYVTAEGAQGVTLDGVTDAATGAQIPPGAQVFTGQVQGAGADSMIPKSVVKENINAAISTNDLTASLDQLEALAKDPTLFGAAGAIRGLAQEGTEQVRGLANLFGADGDAAAGAIQQSLPAPMQGFDNALPQLDAGLKALSFKVAKVLDDSGRLSNDDRRIAAEIAGGTVRSQADFLARAQQLRGMIARSQAARGAAMGRPPGTGQQTAPEAPVAAPPAQPAPSAKPRIKIDAQGRIVP